MRLGKRTAQLVREAAVLGFVQGTRFAGGHIKDEEFPKDSWVVARTLQGARTFPDLYPTLSKVEPDPPVLPIDTGEPGLVEILAALGHPAALGSTAPTPLPEHPGIARLAARENGSDR